VLADRAHKIYQILISRAVLGQCAQWGTNQTTLNRMAQEEKTLVARAQ